MTKIMKSILTIILFSIFGILTINAFAAKISNCSNCTTNNNFKNDEKADKKNKYQFARDLRAKSGFGTKIFPDDPFFYVRSFEIRCKNIIRRRGQKRMLFLPKDYIKSWI